MSACHWERAKVQQRLQELKQQLDRALEQEIGNRAAIERLRQELLRSSEALAYLPDCSE